MLVAVFKVHVPVGFFMNWYGTQKGEGYEYHLLAMAIALAIVIRGAGSASVDYALSGNRYYRTGL
jgi:putative oxidoreductase